MPNGTLEETVDAPENKGEKPKVPTIFESAIDETYDAVKGISKIGLGGGAIAGSTYLLGISGLVTSSVLGLALLSRELPTYLKLANPFYTIEGAVSAYGRAYTGLTEAVESFGRRFNSLLQTEPRPAPPTAPQETPQTA